MRNSQISSLEEALKNTESLVDATVKAAAVAMKAIKRVRAATQTGNVRELPKTIEGAEQALDALSNQFLMAKQTWNFDEGAYLSSRHFVSEVIDAAKETGVKIFEQDEMLYCYPFLIRVLPDEQTVMIDKAKERRLRPSVLANHLKQLQSKPVRFKSEAFLESLHSAYSDYLIDRKTTTKGRRQDGKPVRLTKVYKLFTLLPGLTRDYSKQEFARDLYLLDESRVTTTRDGYVITLHSPRGTEPDHQVFRIVTKDGSLKRYWGISFSK